MGLRRMKKLPEQRTKTTQVAAQEMKGTKSVSYAAFNDGSVLVPPQSTRVFGTAAELKVVKHEVVTRVRYLLEYPDGSRRWREEWKQREEEDDDEDDDDEVLERIRSKRRGD